MSEQKNYSKLDSILKMLLIAFVCILSFSFGVIAGKGLSDKEHSLQSLNESEYSSEKFTENAQVKRMPVEKNKQVKTSDANKVVNQVLNKTRKEMSDASKKKQAMKKPLLPRKVASSSTTKVKEAKPDIKGVQKAAARIAMGNSPSTKKASTQPRVPSSLPKSVGKRRIEYTVQIASYPTPEDANRHSAELIEKGFPAFPVTATVKGRTWYRVSVGTFKSRKEATQYKSQILKHNSVKTAIVQKIGR